MKYKDIIASILDIDDVNKIKEDDDLDELNFDSLARINLISFIDDEANIEIDPEEIENIKTVFDLNNFIESKLKS
tara:strand:+ start:283 stop:507 length:225 start_codon:yes stop_codon:yes gene_type:complete